MDRSLPKPEKSMYPEKSLYLGNSLIDKLLREQQELEKKQTSRRTHCINEDCAGAGLVSDQSDGGEDDHQSRDGQRHDGERHEAGLGGRGAVSARAGGDWCAGWQEANITRFYSKGNPSKVPCKKNVVL